MKIDADTTVYVTSLWWRYNEPFWSVATLDEGLGEKLSDIEAKEEAERAYDDESYDSVDEAADDIMWSGTHGFALGDVVRDEGDLSYAIRDLEDDGYFYPEAY